MDNSCYTLLIVDDETDIRHGLSSYLQSIGFVVLEAPNAKNGLVVFTQHQPDLVICDLSLPQVDGLGLLEDIYQINPNVPAIVISNSGVMADLVLALRLGAIDYLVKPVIDKEALLHSIQKGLERHQLRKDNFQYRIQLEDANSRLKEHIAVLEQDQKAGHFVQQSMLPVSPFYAGNYISEHRVVPSLYLSGDCVDYAFIKQRYYAFYLADISGHGSAAAFVSIWLKNLVAQLVRLKQMLVRFESPTAALLELLHVVNDELIDMGINNHLTLVIGILDTETNRLYYVVAGHLPLPVLLCEGKASFLKGGGRPLGLYQNVDWEVQEQQLMDLPFSLLLFSDGVMELLCAETLEKKERKLLSHIEETEGNLDRLIHLIGVADTNPLPDDVALLSIKKVY